MLPFGENLTPKCFQNFCSMPWARAYEIFVAKFTNIRNFA